MRSINGLGKETDWIEMDTDKEMNQEKELDRLASRLDDEPLGQSMRRCGEDLVTLRKIPCSVVFLGRVLGSRPGLFPLRVV